MIDTAQLRQFLLDHPWLVLELGLHLVLDFPKPFGFDLQKTLPTRQWLTTTLRTLDRGLLTDLLDRTVQALQDEIPGLGEVVSFDVKHSSAWVQEHNERASVAERYDLTRRLAGDPDCKLGVKGSTNTVLADGSKEEKKELLWGSGSGVAAATTSDYGAIVLAEFTQTFNEGDVTSVKPLHRQAVHALQQYPTPLAADALLLMPGTSLMLPFAMAASPPFPSTLMPQPSLTRTRCRAVPSGCVCIPPLVPLIPLAIMLNAIGVRSGFPPPLVRPASILNVPKAPAASGTSMTSLAAVLAS